jgi:tagatose 1,6-diphosphate aldolase
MAVALPAGKLWNLMILADETGRFKMLAIDQRTSLQRSLETILGRRARYEEIGRIKRAIIRALTPHGTAVLTDSEYGYPQGRAGTGGKRGPAAGNRAIRL